VSTTNWHARRQRKAQLLLQPLFDQLQHENRGVWADLGCGDGVFTRLLAQWLQPGSTIYAVDKEAAALRRLERRLERRVRGEGADVAIQPLHADFTRPLPLPRLNGLLLANSLHFVSGQEPVLTQLVTRLAPSARVVIIEYNATRQNPAVPHPIPATACLDLMRAVGLRDAQIAARVPSSFLGEMYAASAYWCSNFTSSSITKAV